jgi:flagellar hook assembly protein FlgD
MITLHFIVPNNYRPKDNAKVMLFDVNGRVIDKITINQIKTGNNSFTWNLNKKKIATGTYFVIIKIGVNVFTHKVNYVN